MSKIDKSESSCRNGAKSHGPVSPEGRERSSQNAVKFGIYAKRVRVLSTENKQDLEDLRDHYFQEWLPADRRQCDLVEKLVDSEWRFLRFASLERWLVEDMMSQMLREVDHMYVKEPDPDLRASLAYDRLYKQGPTLEKFQRERHRLGRIIDRTTRLLLQLQQQPIEPDSDDHPDPVPQNIENEPENPAETPSTNPSQSPENPESSARAWSSPCYYRLKPTSEPPEVALATGY